MTTGDDEWSKGTEFMLSLKQFRREICSENPEQNLRDNAERFKKEIGTKFGCEESQNEIENTHFEQNRQVNN